MVKVIMHVEGMACGMCEAHVNEAVRKAFSVKSVSSDHVKGETVVIAQEAPDEQKLRDVVAECGYTVTEISSEPYEKEKKGFSFFKK